jgi:MFS-type transporter involved in bile tolerance (Atg22 family)
MPDEKRAAMATDGAGPAGTAASTWAPLRIGVFRGLFIAALTSNIGTWMQTVGAQWFLVERHASPTVIALVQTASLTPTLILALFAGALADRVDRRRLLIAVQVYAAVATAVLTALAVAGVLDAVSLLVLLFAIGCAAAMTTPAWQAIQPELVPREQLRSAASLGGVAVDAAGDRPSHRRVTGGCGRRRGGVRNQYRVLCCSDRRAVGLEADTFGAGNRA